MPAACAPKQEKPLQGEAHALRQRAAPLATTKESLCKAVEDPVQPEINK